MRIRHFRGRKVHSPFVYGIVRNCLMPSRRQPAEKQIEALFDYLNSLSTYEGEAVCILCHRKNRRARKEMIARHGGTSFETRKFLCIFTGERLPKQHFKL
jgi:hypothetical protein